MNLLLTTKFLHHVFTQVVHLTFVNQLKSLDKRLLKGYEHEDSFINNNTFWHEYWHLQLFQQTKLLFQAAILSKKQVKAKKKLILCLGQRS